MALFDDEDEQSGNGTESHSSGGNGGGPIAALETATIADDDPSGTLKRAVDSEAGVVVYAYKNGSGCGLSTVPLSETDLTPADDQ